jgi:hypothetical protein
MSWHKTSSETSDCPKVRTTFPMSPARARRMTAVDPPTRSTGNWYTVAGAFHTAIVPTVMALVVLAGCGGSPASQTGTSVAQSSGRANGTTSTKVTQPATPSTKPAARPALSVLIGTRNSSKALCAHLPAARANAIIRPVALALGGGGQPQHLRAFPLKPSKLGSVAASGCQYSEYSGSAGQIWLLVYVTRGLPEKVGDPALRPTLSRFVLDGHKAIYSPGTTATLGFLHVLLPAKVVLDIEPRFGLSQSNPVELDPKLKPFAQQIAMAILANGGPGVG